MKKHQYSSNDHHLVGFYISQQPEGVLIKSGCTCGAKLESMGKDTASATDSLWQLFTNHKLSFTPTSRMEIAEDKHSAGKRRKHRNPDSENSPHPQVDKHHPRTKLTEEQAYQIRRDYATRKYTQSELAKQYGVSIDKIRKTLDDMRKVDAPSDADDTLFLATKRRGRIGLTQSQLAVFAEQIRRGQISISKAAQELSVSRPTLYLAFQEANLNTAKVYSLEERFHCNFTKGGDNECWTWRGQTIANLPYFWSGTKRINARRFAFSLAYGPLKDNKNVHVWCGNPLCVNPAHLFS